MLTLLASTGRVLAGHWPALVAWFLAGYLLHFGLIQLAGYVGAWSTTGGLLLLPLAILARLIAFVAMFLVVRDGLRELQAIAPVPQAAAERRQTFLNTLLASILPFFAVYAAWGMLQDDVIAYDFRALQVRSDIGWRAIVDGSEAPTGALGTDLTLDAVTGMLIVVAFAGRWAWKKWPKKLPAPFSVLAVYLEAVWVLLSIMVIKGALEGLQAWVDTRVGIQWALEFRDWVGEQLTPLAWVWDGVEWFIGQLAGLTVEPLAWLAIAGVIYGQAIAAEKPKLDIALYKRARTHVDRVPSLLRRMLGQLGAEFTSRFTPIIDAIVLMWRAGPVLIGTYILLYTIVLAGDTTLDLVISRLIGPQSLADFWQVISDGLVLFVAVIVEPIRISVVAGAYDDSLGALRRYQHVRAATTPTGGQGSTENLTKLGNEEISAISTQNGPSASSGTM
ncbi:hypothetical protein OED01_01990 [Microbacterium sp. M28]|uniref:hypothetical protein n=1 Tax=Microbacterium sp. M28 TaxID=2962064 RepID=UPI0021F4479C|nr:hypothetical protein [Microbacterium sp. M28]UYO97528.1 hypothetical protein OED01_01990 [Microbacterium sp. M28]